MNKKAFTLIELLVVMAIIAVLLAIVAPSLRLAREQARGVYCRNNLKQMCMAASTYTLSNDDYYPISYYRQTVQNAAPEAFSVSASSLVPDEPAAETVSFLHCWDFTTITRAGQTQTQAGTLWQGDTVDQIQQCPSYKGGDNWTSNPFTGYNYNTSYIGHGQGESVRSNYTGAVRGGSDMEEPIVMPAKASQVRSPSMCVLFGDGQYAGGANKIMRSPFVWEGDIDWDVRPGGTQGYRHGGRTNVAWAGGHVTAQQEVYTETHPKYKGQLEAYNKVNKVKIGFLSPDNSVYDLK